MLKLVNDWYRRHFTDPQVAILALLLVLGATILYVIGDVLTPLLASIIIAYLLDGAVGMLKKHKVPRLVAILSTFSIFIILLLIVLFILAPLLIRQANQLFSRFQKCLLKGRHY